MAASNCLASNGLSRAGDLPHSTAFVSRLVPTLPHMTQDEEEAAIIDGKNPWRVSSQESSISFLLLKFVLHGLREARPQPTN